RMDDLCPEKRHRHERPCLTRFLFVGHEAFDGEDRVERDECAAAWTDLKGGGIRGHEVDRGGAEGNAVTGVPFKLTALRVQLRAQRFSAPTADEDARAVRADRRVHPRSTLPLVERNSAVTLSPSRCSTSAAQGLMVIDADPPSMRPWSRSRQRRSSMATLSAISSGTPSSTSP